MHGMNNFKHLNISWSYKYFILGSQQITESHDRVRNNEIIRSYVFIFVHPEAEIFRMRFCSSPSVW
jgi:hypothetical protein